MSLELLVSKVVEEQANRSGKDTRPGRRVKLRVNSRGFLVEGGKSIVPGEQVIDDVHIDDVKLFESLVEKATGEHFRAAESRLAALNEEYSRDRRRFPPSLEQAFREVHGRDIKPLVSVQVIDDKR